MPRDNPFVGVSPSVLFLISVFLPERGRSLVGLGLDTHSVVTVLCGGGSATSYRAAGPWHQHTLPQPRFLALSTTRVRGFAQPPPLGSAAPFTLVGNTQKFFLFRDTSGQCPAPVDELLSSSPQCMIEHHSGCFIYISFIPRVSRFSHPIFIPGVIRCFPTVAPRDQKALLSFYQKSETLFRVPIVQIIDSPYLCLLPFKYPLEYRGPSYYPLMSFRSLASFLTAVRMETLNVLFPQLSFLTELRCLICQTNS